MTSLGRLKKINLRTVWKHEAIHFTQWLAQEDNLALLSSELEIDIKLIQTEAKVGSFNVDILAVEENTDNKIIIENQLGATDHDHLGKIITYGSGYNAKVIVWVVENVREEHRNAIDWLNENTGEEIGFYLLKIELWQIENSLPAPKFEIVSKPNDWVKAVKNSTGSAELTDTKIRQLEFWDAFKLFAKQNSTTLRFQKSHPQHWTDLSIGSSECHLVLTVNSKEKKLACEVYIPDNKKLYFNLFEHKSEIEIALQEKLEWMELPDKKASRIKLITDGDFNNKQEWSKQFRWMQEKAEVFQKIFSRYL